MINTIMNWQGGKVRLADKLNRVLNVRHKVYIEPFLGSGGLFLNREISGAKEIINDLDIGICSLWKTLAGDRYREFMESFCTLSVEPKRFNNYKIQKNMGYPDSNTFQKALVIYYLTVYSFNGDMRSMVYKNSPEMHEEMGKKARTRLMENVENAHIRASNATILNKNAIDIIKEYKDNLEALIYIDPPYVHELMGDRKDLYNIRFSTSEQKALLELIMNAKAKICISGYRGGSLLYDQYLNKETGWHTYLLGEVTRSAGMYRAQKGNSHNKAQEFIWTNYALPETASYSVNSVDLALSIKEVEFYLKYINTA